jgi:hypothetical protein
MNMGQILRRARGSTSGSSRKLVTGAVAAVAVAVGISTTVASASVTPQWVAVPISAAAIAADPNLANFRTYDLQVTQSGSDHWAGTDLRVGLESGKFYVPPTNDQRWAKSNLWTLFPNLAYDTFITSPDSLANPSSADGTPAPGSHLIVLGEASYPTLGTPGAPGTMPDATNDKTKIDIAYGDLYVTQSTFGDGTNTVARLTVSNDAVATVGGRVTGTHTVNGTRVDSFYFPAAFRITAVPEPTTLGALTLGLGALAVRRRKI